MKAFEPKQSAAVLLLFQPGNTPNRKMSQLFPTAYKYPPTSTGSYLPGAAMLTFFLTVTCLNSRSQMDAIFKKENYRQTMPERRELDSATRKKFFVITPYKPQQLCSTIKKIPC